MQLRLGSIVEALGGELCGDPERLIEGLAPLESADSRQLSFLASAKYQSQLADSRAACVIVGPALREAALARGDCIVAEQPYLYFARVTQLWKSRLAVAAGPAVHPSAVIDPDAVIDPTARIGPLCVIERGARIGAGTVLKARVTIGEDCVIGARCIVHPGVVIGADGFGFAPDGGSLGKDRAARRGAHRGRRRDRRQHLHRPRRAAGHRDRGRRQARQPDPDRPQRAASAGTRPSPAAPASPAAPPSGPTAPSAARAGILGHLTIADHVHISATSFVTRSILKPGHYTGIFPIDDNAAWEKNAATLKQLHKLRERVKALEKKTDS